MRQVALAGNVREQMGNITEFWLFWANVATQRYTGSVHLECKVQGRLGKQDLVA